MTATPTLTTAAEWARFRGCHICGAAAGLPCQNLRAELAPGQERHRPHVERLVTVDRDAAGRMVMAVARPVHNTQRRIAYVAHALHAGLTVCGGHPIVGVSLLPLEDVPVRQRCQRASCKRLWRAEEEKW